MLIATMLCSNSEVDLKQGPPLGRKAFASVQQVVTQQFDGQT